MDTNKVKSNVKTNEGFKISGNWDEQSKKLKSKFPKLTDSDLKVESGKEHEMISRVESRLNKNRDEVMNIMKNNQEAKA